MKHWDRPEVIELSVWATMEKTPADKEADAATVGGKTYAKS